MNPKKGKLIIFSAPSGAGKTTLVKHLLNHRDDLAFSITCCTREPRVGEIDGEDYFFISEKAFKEKINNNEFAEWEEVYKDHFYGTLNAEIERIWNEGKHVIFDVDVVGGLNLKNKFKERALSIFVQPPNVQTLAERLKNRNTDSEDKLKTRIAKAKHELSFAPKFDVILINDNLDTAKEEVNKLASDFLD